MDYSDVRTVRYVTFQPYESSYNISISCPIRPLLNYPHLYTYEWELRFRGIPDSNSPDLKVAIEPSFSSSSSYQCVVTIQHSPSPIVRGRYKIYIETFGKVLVIYIVCVYTHVYTCIFIT